MRYVGIATILVQCLASAATFHWLAQRMRWGVGEPGELVAAACAVGWVLARPARTDAPRLWPSSVLLLGSTTLHLAAGRPGLASSALAVLALAWTACACRAGTPCFSAVAVLGLLSLPAAGVLHVQLDFPLRLSSTALAAPLLRLSGFAVEAVGTGLEWAGSEVWVDAPCSGTRLLWSALFLGAAISLLHRSGNRATLRLLGCALLLAIAANALRTAALFLPQVRGELPASLHLGVGLVLQAGLASALVYLARRSLPSTVRA